MYFDYKSEYQKFMFEFEVQKKLMQESGMNEADIKDIFEFDKAVFNHNRSFYRHKADYVEANEDDKNFFEQQKGKQRTEHPPREFEECFSFAEQLGDKVYKAFCELNKKEQEVVVLSYDKNLSLYQISDYLAEPYDTVQKRLYRAIKKIKTFF